MLFMVSMGATFLIKENLAWLQAIYLGFIVFCGWSGVDAINNICDADLDVKSDPLKAEYTRSLGRLGLYISIFFSSLSISMGVITGIPLVTVFILMGIFAGVLYSIPPFRLRQTICKPLVNFSVGAIPILIVAAFFNVFSAEVWSLMLLIGITTAVNSLWEDLADYASDFHTRAKTMLIVLDFRRGLHVTIVLGYCLIPLMVLVGILFNLNMLYFLVFTALVAYMSLRIIQKRSVLFEDLEDSTESILKLGEIFAKDFAIIAIIQMTNLMLSSYLKYQPAFLG
ncbi:MAG: UbiA family prenyltransferase [Candidatus Bathyarchaeota archaeon]|nr:UbiA family prenyltransferase [Candidatus Bathyarchaeota archaeon]